MNKYYMQNTALMHMVSSGNTWRTLTGMTIGEFVKQQRAEQALSQAELARRIGMSPSHLAQIENGKIKLPGADVRRKIAGGLGLSQVELLLASGELEQDELATAGKAIPQREEAPGSAEIHRLVDQVEWTPRRVQGFADMLRFIASEPMPQEGQALVRNGDRSSH